MKKNFKLLVLLLGLGVMFTCVSCEDTTKVVVPDYSKYTDQYDFYGYSAASTGEYYIDNVRYYVGENLLNETQYQYYIDSGLTIFFPQNRLSCSNQAQWEVAKAEIDKLVSMGMDKTIVFDGRISGLSKTVGGIVGEGKQFETVDDLDAYVADCLSLYGDYPGVYGVMIGDEPFYTHLESYSDLYNSVRRVSKKLGYNLFIQYNLNPFTSNNETALKVYGALDPELVTGNTFEDNFTAYKIYINKFLDAMQPDYFQYDDYPLMVGDIKTTFIRTLQYSAQNCKERGIPFYLVSQTYQMTSNGNAAQRWENDADLRWLNNMEIGFGIKQISYFTYFSKADNQTNGEFFIDGASWVTRFGERTEIYYYMQQILKENQKFAPTMLQFDYQTSKVIQATPLKFISQHINYVLECEPFTVLEEAKTDNEIALITELYDDENGNYMYMAQNICDTLNTGSGTYENITLKFQNKYNYAIVWRNGEAEYYKLNNHSITIQAGPGEASYVIPF